MDTTPNPVTTVDTPAGRLARHPLYGNLLLALLYCITAQLGLLLAAPPGYATIVWPPSGIALGWVLLFGPRLLPGIALGSCAATLLAVARANNLSLSEVAWTLPVLIGLGAAAQAWLGAWLVQRFAPPDPAFEEPAAIIKTLLLGGLLATLLNASWSITLLHHAGAVSSAQLLHNWFVWWVGDSIGVLVFTPLLLVWGLPHPYFNRTRALIATAVSGTTFALACGAFFLGVALENKDRVREFQLSSERAINQMQQRIAEYEQFSLLTRGFFDSSDYVSRQEFHRFVQEWLNTHPEVQAVGWAPRIEAADRRHWEQQVSAELGRPVAIRESPDRRQLVPAAQRPAYLPLMYMEPVDANRHLLGFDTTTNPVSPAILQAAMRSARPHLTAPLVLLQATDGKPGVLLYTPVYRPGSTQRHETDLRGFLVVSLMAETMLSHIIRELVPDAMTLRIRDQTSAVLLYGTEPAPATARAAHRIGLYHHSRLMAGNQVWEVEAWPTAHSLAARQSWLTWLVLITGLIGTSLAVSYALASTGRRQYLERAIARHTRTLRVRNTELEDARVAADLANTAKSQFLANMSHEIRTPMNAVLGMADLLQGTELDTHQQQCLQVIRISGQALLSIINDILDHSKIEAGKMEVEQIDMDLEALLLECASIFSLTAENKHLEFIAFLEPGTPIFIQSDPTRLRQILLNLLSNAFKFTEQGQVSLQVYLGSIRNEPHLFLEVRDTGIGLTEAQHDRLFQAFNQADTSTTRQFGGTGLGLSISKRLLDLMHGDIRLESHPGAGAAFTVRIPYRPASAAYIHNHYVPLAPLHGLRLLLADALPEFSHVLAEQAHGWGLQTEIHATAASALARAREARDQHTPFDLMVLDQHLPDNGHDLPALLQEPGLARLRTVLMAPLGLGRDREPGGALVIPRPASAVQLRDTLLQLAAPTGTDPDARPAAAHNPLAGRRVLVVEDNSVNRMVILGMLKKFDVIADIAVNGLEALNVHRANPQGHDLILMDCEMPVMDGYQASRAIRRFEQDHDLPRTGIVALTAHALRGQQTRCLEAGMDECLIKPLSLDRLKHMLMQRLPPVSPVPSESS